MGLRRAILFGLMAGLLVVAGIAGLLVVRSRSGQAEMEQLGDRVFVVVAGRGGPDLSQVAQLVGVVNTSGGRLRVELIDPLSKVALSGTTYDTLRDAYPFGGGVGVASAWERLRGMRAMPVVTVSERAFATAVDRWGGIEATVPVAANVFDGTRLFSFSTGRQHLSGAQARALLGSAEYLTDPAARVEIWRAVVTGLARAAASNAPDLRDLGNGGGMTSTLRPADLQVWADLLRTRAGEATVTAVP